MRQTVLVTLAAATLVLPALPGQAAGAAQSGAVRNSAASSERPRADNAEERRICVRARFSNSRIARNVCKTRAEWDAQGGLERDD